MASDSNDTSPIITEPERVAALALDIAAHRAMAFDIEFVSEGRMIPELSLLQVAFGAPASPRVAAVDCVAVGAKGLAPLFELIGRDDIDTVAHSARQDLGLLAVRHGVRARGLWDTQIAAAFLGLGDQISYGKLIHQLLGRKLDKGSQFTAWLERPLSARQIQYALDDVRYLPGAWEQLRQQLEQHGRLAWVREESERLAASARPLAPPEEAYLEVKGWRALDGAQLSSLRALAAWRQRLAVADNKPLSWILPDPALIELCRRPLRSARDLRSVRGVGDGTVRRHGDDILAVIAQGATEPPPAVDEPARPALSQRAQIWAALLASLVQARALAETIAPRFLATRSDAELLADWFDRGAEPPEPAIDLLTGWRRELAGDLALAWLRGEVTLAASSSRSGVDVRSSDA